MRSTNRWITLLVAGCAVFSRAAIAAAADPEISLSILPLRQVFVQGDKEKFRAQHWMKDQYTGGVENLSARGTLPNGVEYSSEGHAIVDQNDFGGAFRIKKENLGFVNLDFKEFRKYYDTSGGVYSRFSTFPVTQLDRDLHLDIGKLEVETGLTLEHWPELDFVYEHEFRKGVKSRLSWASVTEVGLVRKIAPSWEEIDEVTDAVALKARHEIKGFTLKGEQRWEFTRSENVRQERQLTTTITTSDGRVRIQDQEPRSRMVTSTWGAERWFMDNKALFATGYRFSDMENREFETNAEFDANGNPRSFSNSENKPNARADNRYHTHTWNQNFMISPWNWLNVGTKLKAELTGRKSNSSYPSDITDPPDGLPNTTNQNITNDKARRWGEGLSLRFTAIPHTALYNELELEQSRTLLREDQKNLAGQDAASSTNDFSRETVTKAYRGTWTLGGRFEPWRFVDLTTQVRRRVNNIDYDDQRETTPGSSTARSAFFDGQTIHTDEFAGRLTLKPWRWLRPSFRYQFRNDKYATRVENEPIVKTGMLSHVFTYDLTLQPRDDFLTTLSFSRQTLIVVTPANLGNGTYNIPTGHSNVDTWLISTDYMPTPTVTLTNSMLYSRAPNFNSDLITIGIPLGADNERLDLTTGVKWAARENLTLGAGYGFYHYRANGNAEFGNYNANMIWLDGTLKF